MNNIDAFARGLAAQGNPQKVFDWEKAARLIAAKNPKRVEAGLHSDWEWTGGTIWEDGKPVTRDKSYTYLSSNWATPEIDIDGDVRPCWRYATDSPGWGSDTSWPPEALKLLEGVTDALDGR